MLSYLSKGFDDEVQCWVFLNFIYENFVVGTHLQKKHFFVQLVSPLRFDLINDGGIRLKSIHFRQSFLLGVSSDFSSSIRITLTRIKMAATSFEHDKFSVIYFRRKMLELNRFKYWGQLGLQKGYSIFLQHKNWMYDPPKKIICYWRQIYLLSNLERWQKWFLQIDFI